MKLCVIFPGIGYNADKPLLYYTKKYVHQAYEIMDIKYSGDPIKAKSQKSHLLAFYQNAYTQVEKQLSAVSFRKYDDILFVSKSVGTALSERYAREHGLKVRSILFTPLNFTFEGKSSQAIAFSGTSDPWINLDEIKQLSKENGVPLTIINHANHSLETGDVLMDIDHLHGIMEKVIAFIAEKNRD